MKKLGILLLACGLFFTLVAEGLAQRNPETDPEKIYLFDSVVTVHQNGSITVTENITLNAKHQKINRGIYRDIPVSWKESVHPVSLELDGQTHPFFTRKNGQTLRINFGNDDYIPVGEHTYTFVYTFVGAIDFYKNYDELYWNVTGNDWYFGIDKARVRVQFEPDVVVQQDGISVYTGPKGRNATWAEKTAPLTYETTRPLHPSEGMTIAVPFDKGAIEKPSVFQSFGLFFQSLRPVPAVSFILLAILFIYFVITWIFVGIDPFYMAVPQYEPPEGISPAFMRYLCEHGVDTSAIACVLVHLSMEGYIEINEKKDSSSQSKVTLTLKNGDTQNLPLEEVELINLLFPNGIDTLVMGPSTARSWQQIVVGMKKLFAQNAKAYVISNATYITTTALLLAVLGIIPALCVGKKVFPLLFVNFYFAIFFYLAVIWHFHFRFKFWAGLFLTSFYIPFWLAICAGKPDALICCVAYLAGMWGMAFYVPLIRNVTPAGKELFAHIYGFKKYMKTAEIYRVAASSPVEAEKIFCNFLPYAFAFGLGNEWMKKFGKILSQATLERCTACVGGTKFLSSGLIHCVNSSVGGRKSGGGHGGGGGGGR